MATLKSYEKLEDYDVKVLSLIQTHFKDLFLTIHCRLTVKQSVQTPWRIVIKEKIYFDIFIQ